MPEARLELHALREDPELCERFIEEENKLAAIDPAARERVVAMYWERDREQAFKRFSESLDFQQIDDLFAIFGVGREHEICEIGGGSGQLAWSLAKAGYQHVDLLEPNALPITGTGWLRSEIAAGRSNVRICNSLDAWYADDKLYDVIVTRNCVHHFPNIAMVAAAVHQKMRPGGRWVMIREQFADTPEELRAGLRNHPYCQKYKTYEFFFPARYYVESLELAGFKLTSVVPAKYGNNALSTYSNDTGTPSNQRRTARWRSVLQRKPCLTVACFRSENFLVRSFGYKRHRFTRPQVILFERV